MLEGLSTERRAWLAELYEDNFSPVFRTCSGVLRNRDDAADASQEVFLIAANSLPPGTAGPVARAWLQTVARNYCVDVLRRRKRMDRVLITLGGDAHDHEDIAASVADRDFVDAVLEKLSPRERQALWQSAVEHRALGDIADRLQLSYMAAAQVIHRARRHALKLAARLAIILGALRLGRRVNQMALTAAQVAAVPVIAVSVVSLPTSGPPPTSTRFDAWSPPAVSRAASTGLVPQAGSGPLVLPAPVPSNATSTMRSALGAVTQSVQQVSGSGLSNPLNDRLLPLLPTPAVPALPVGTPNPPPPLPSLP